ncbi:MAG TPA: hypothetical protein VHH90_07310 [Polyangia bacterium]|nr:hypothetical protein [Polyangia bacterium]
MRLAVLGGVATLGLAAGCTDSVRTSEPAYASAGAGGGGSSGGPGGGVGNPEGGLSGAATGGQTGQGGQAGQAPTTGAGGNVVATGGQGGSGGAAGSPSVLAPPAPVGLVSLNSDYLTTSLSLLSESGGSINGDCVHSSTLGNGTSKTISGDAVLPSQPQLGGDIVIVDRGNGALTFVDPSGCFIARQVAIPGGASTNPHDVVIVSAHKAYVTRYQPNSTSGSPQQAGNDVIAIDPTTGAYLSRISLDTVASTGAGAAVLARPDRALIADGRVVVSLNQVDATFSTYGDGAVVIIDPASDKVVATVALPGLTDCEGMDFVAASHTLLVACGGTFGSRDQPLQSGIAVVDLGASMPRFDHSVSAVAFDGHPVSFGWVLAAPSAAAPGRAFAATYDPKGIAPDALFQCDFVSGAVTPVTKAAAFSIGAPALAGQLLFVPEAPLMGPTVQLVDVKVAPQPNGGFTADPKNGLPPREIAWY